MNLKNYLMTAMLAAFALAATGCNTTKGIGQDIEAAGEEIQEEVEERT